MKAIGGALWLVVAAMVMVTAVSASAQADLAISNVQVKHEGNGYRVTADVAGAKATTHSAWVNLIVANANGEPMSKGATAPIYSGHASVLLAPIRADWGMHSCPLIVSVRVSQDGGRDVAVDRVGLSLNAAGDLSPVAAMVNGSIDTAAVHRP